MISGLIAGYRTMGRWMRRLNSWYEENDGPKKFLRMAKDFLAEAAVLVAVFPILDAMIASREPKVPPVTWKWIIISGLIALGLFLAAAVVSVSEQGKGE